MTDYAAIYSTYWNDPDRWGTCSLRDASETADSILATCGPGRLLDVGCGMGALVRTLLRHAVDAHGLDVASKCVDQANALTPGRFTQGSLLELPFADKSFDTVTSTDVLEHLSEQDVPRALAEMARVARRALFIRVATTPDRDGAWHLTVRDRAWWEARCFEAGLRRHPLLLIAVPYEAMESEGWQATLVLEKIPQASLARWPLGSLKAERNLHMDMLREAGRRSDAHLARYHLACQFVRPADVVLDVACGLGYGSAVLAAGSQASRVIGMDESGMAVEYARACYAGEVDESVAASGGSATSLLPIEFHRANAQDLSRLADGTVDVVVSFETLEHLPEPARFLDEARRVLRPAGRLILSVPNQWTDESGRDPNPYHLHVYDWSRLAAEVAPRFIVEKRYAQVAGGGMRLRDAPRSLREIAVADASGNAPPSDAEWWLVVAMKEPVGAPRDGYADAGYPDHSNKPAANVGAFGRDYDNPWLVRAMVALGLRCTSKGELQLMAQRVIAAPANPASPDLGAALCVLGYRMLEGSGVSVGDTGALLARLATYERAVTDAGPTARPHARRWVISNAYMGAQLLLATGRRAEARAEFQRCASMDVLTFSPLLASKTIDASYHAALIAACDGDLDAAAADFKRGLGELVRVLGAGDWANILGSIDDPLTFGLVDLQQGVELASRCAFGLASIPLLRDRPAFAWTLLRRRALADLKRWSEQQGTSIEWLREQRRELEAALTDARAWIAQQDKGRTWLEQNTAALAARLESLARESAEQRERHRALADEQRLATEARLRERDAAIDQLRAFLESQRSGEQWLLAQKRELEAALRQRDARILEMQGAIAKLMEGRDWLLKRAQQVNGPALPKARPTPPVQAPPHRPPG